MVSSCHMTSALRTLRSEGHVIITVSLFKILNGENKRAGLKIRGYVVDGLLTSVATSENKAAAKLQEVFTMAKK